MTTEEFENIVKDWIATAKHPATKRPLTEMVYQPMVELLANLRANGFKTLIVSGGGIQTHIGRRPIATFGNSDGDLQMLQYTHAGTGPRFCLYIHHTDPAREWSYDRTPHIGQLDKGLDEATAKGWTIVNMKDDWKIIFPSEKK